MTAKRSILSLICCIAVTLPLMVSADTNGTATIQEKEAPMTAMLDFYRTQSAWTSPGTNGSMYDGIPDGITNVVHAVQNVLVHGGMLWLYKISPSDQQGGGMQIRRTDELLSRIARLKTGSLTLPRSGNERLVVNCRQFAVLTCSILRAKGFPARARAGYARYTWGRGKLENHWICEYWHTTELRWIHVDAQIDAPQRDLMRIDFNTVDIPPGEFVPAGDGWQAYRKGQIPLDAFGLGGKEGWNGMGWSMVMPNVVSDVMALNKDEMLPWDIPPYWSKKESEMSADDIALIDRLAAAEWTELRTLYAKHASLQMPEGFETRKQE